MSLPLQRRTLLNFPICTSDVNIGVVMWMNSWSTKIKPSHHLCLTLDNYDSLPNQSYLPVFETLAPFVQESLQEISAVILDGAAVVQMLKPIGVTTFEQYALDIIKPYIMSQLNTDERVDIVWGTYKGVGGCSLVVNTRETWKRHPPAGYSVNSRAKELARFLTCWQYKRIITLSLPGLFYLADRCKTSRSWSQTALKC